MFLTVSIEFTDESQGKMRQIGPEHTRLLNPENTRAPTRRVTTRENNASARPGYVVVPCVTRRGAMGVTTRVNCRRAPRVYLHHFQVGVPLVTPCRGVSSPYRQGVLGWLACIGLPLPQCGFVSIAESQVRTEGPDLEREVPIGDDVLLARSELHHSTIKCNHSLRAILHEGCGRGYG